MNSSPDYPKSIAGLIARCVTYPRTVLAVWLFVSALCALSAVNLNVDTTIGSALDRSGPEWAVYERSLVLHGGDEFISVALKPSAEPYDVDSLRDLLELSDRLDGLDGIRRVDSLATVPLIRSDETEALIVGPGLDRDVLSDPESVREFARQVNEDLIARGSLVSGDGRTFALNLVFEDDVDGDRESLVELVREIVSAYPGTVMSGVPIVRADAGALTRSEIVKFVPITVMAISVFLIFVFREVRSLLAPLIVGAIGVVVCLGIMSAMDVSLSFSTSVLPSVILALACAYTMHFLNASRGAGCHDEMADRLAPVAKPVILSGTTTALGFLAMSTSEISLISDLATFGALGVIVVTFAAVTAAPSVLSIFPLRSESSVGLLAFLSQVLAPKVVEFSARRRREIIAVWLLIILAIALGLPKLHVASDVITWFPRDGQLRTSYVEIRQRLSGITPVNILIEVPEGRVVTTPELIHTIGRFSSALEAHPSVGKSLSVAEPISLVHRELAGWNVSELPMTQELINQYLLLLDGVEQMDDVVTKDRTSANILLRLNDNSSSEISAVAKWAQEWWEANGSRDASISVTGIMYEFGRAQDAIAFGGLVGLVIALITIGGLIALFFRDVFLSAAALLANVIPVGAILGAVGWLGIPLDAATVCVASLSLGIAVDDTIHVISEFQSNTSVGREPIDALRSTFCVVFPALVITTGVVLIGFGVLIGSEISLVRNLGLMMSVAVVLCLIADSTLLVAVLSLKGRQSTCN